MNSQELRALQEAYNQVYAPQELDEAITSEKGKAKAAEMIAARTTASGRAKSGKGANVAKIRQISVSDKEGLGGTPMTPTMAKNPVKKKNYTGTGNKAARRAAALNTESYDLYDIILSHLLDEGYADTEQAAEAIMVNMSEDWRESIVEGAAGAFVPSKVDDSNNRRDMLKNRYGQDVSPRIPGPSGGGQFEKPSSNPAGALRLAKTSSKGDTKTA